MIVVDTNVIAYLWLPGEHTEAAEHLIGQDPEWAAPLLWRSELRNVISGLVKRGNLALSTAIRIVEEAESHMRGREFSVPSSDVLTCAKESGCTAYDCEFVVLAQALHVPLITSDKEVLSAFPKIAKRLKLKP